MLPLLFRRPKQALDPMFWFGVARMQVKASDANTTQMLYDVLLPHVLGDLPLLERLNRQDKCKLRCGEAAATCRHCDWFLCLFDCADMEWRTSQRSVSGNLKSVIECTRYLLRRKGLSV